MAKTIDAGCKPYMAPERIDPTGNPANYDVRSDVWSFGISMIEIATGKFPYKLWATPFEQLKQVVMDPPPKLTAGEFSVDFHDFIDICLNKTVTQRASYSQLLEHMFLKTNADVADEEVAPFISEVLDLMPCDKNE